MKSVALLFALLGISANGAPATVVASGYAPSAFIVVAPGQILTFSIAGIGAGLTGPVRPSTTTLPTVLAGISATLVQGTPSYAVPILAVEPMATCSDSAAPGCTSYTAVTVQIPFEVQPTCPGGDRGAPIPGAQVRFAENGNVVASVQVYPSCDQIHLLRTCDVLFASSYPHTSSCPEPVVTHADGSLVTYFAPAKVGEEIIIYGVGLGGPSNMGLTGSPPKSPVPIDVAIGFDYRPNAGPTRPPGKVIPFVPAISPRFSGMIPGFAGLYQINVIIPQPPADLLWCEPQSLINSNLTINVGERASFDGVGICVQPGL